MAHQAERVAGVRSWLYTPGTQPQRFDRAAAAGADGLIIDLEDAVPARDKDSARANAVAQLAEAAPGVLQAVRINPPATRAGLRDLDALAGAGGYLDAVVVPKCESPAVLAMVATIFAELGAAPAVIALVETGSGVAAIAELTRAPGLAAAALGAADLSADPGCAPAWETLAVVRGLLVVHAGAARVPLIDSPFFDLADEAGLRAQAGAAAELGFSAKAAIHPQQVPAINAAFAPSAEEIEWAHAALAVAEGGGPGRRRHGRRCGRPARPADPRRQPTRHALISDARHRQGARHGAPPSPAPRDRAEPVSGDVRALLRGLRAG